MPQTILITGASSGLGLAFLQHYAAQTPTPSIIALDTSPLPANAPSSSSISFHQTDITSPPALQSIAKSLNGEAIDLILHSAGIRGLVPSIVASQPGDVSAAETHSAMDHSTFMKTIEINTWGTFNVITSFLPNLQLSENAKVIVMSSRMGSVSANTAGGAYAYRASKAALNTVVKSFSVDVPGVVFLLLHPGRVETGLVGWKEEGAISVEESLGDCLKVIEKIGKKDSGTFVDRFGKVIQW